ncbi:MAG: PhzF family phenazine biosynthesis protein [Candidatus Aminicenantes bacterium]|nr:MAG: PhzF family phenazine biosynthesis protein [Candidatus Aminicenantes bacterium]
MGYEFYIVDVFAEEKYAGNQLGVFRKAEDLADAKMQRIAKEMNYSETTFILTDREKDGGFDVRIFTPEEELPFAGHPTLGTAFVIQQEILQRPIEKVALNLKVGQIPVTFGYKEDRPDVLWMKQKPPVFGQEVDKGELARSLNLEESYIDDKFPIQEVSTGISFLIVPLKSLANLRKAKVDFPKFMQSVENIDAKAPLLFCPEAREDQNDLSVRVFVDYYGIPEDPATGSANGCLAGYLTKHRYFDQNRVDVRVEQGHEIGRPSLLYLKAEEKADDIDVHVGGKAIMVAKGMFV